MTDETTINDLPDVILSNIFAAVTDTRTRNSLSLVNRKFVALERATRLSLTLRGNSRDPLRIPVCFRAVTHLDLSYLSPWGHCLISSNPHPDLLARSLCLTFPRVESLTVYVRSPFALQVLLRQWPRLNSVKLVRWHQRPSSNELGADFLPVFEEREGLVSLDLSTFYYWTEDLPPALHICPVVAQSLTSLNLLTVSLTDGFKSHEICEVTAACKNLTQLLIACVFDQAYIGYVGDETLALIAANCPKLEVLHLVETAALAGTRIDPDEEGYPGEDASFTVIGLVDFFSALPPLRELVLDACKNVKESCLALEALGRKCPQLKTLKLGGFQGICKAVESRLDGIALCAGLRSLSIKKASDLTDMGLIEIARGCCRLSKLEIEGCNKVTVHGMRTVSSLLTKSLVEVKISSCKNLDFASSLKALEPIRDRVERLHLDAVWSSVADNVGSVNLSPCADDGCYHHQDKRCKYTTGTVDGDQIGVRSPSWERLTFLSLWISAGEFLTPLENSDLDDCPKLEAMRVKVEGDCRARRKPSKPEFGLRCLQRYSQLSKLQLDCGDTLGFALTAPSGQMDLSLWERFFLNGIGCLNLVELDYWPPQDRDVNQRSLSLPAAGLLAECVALRKLFIHGTAHEHFMMFLLRIPNLRDVQLREDYYPAPENDMSTEMRVDSCSRFEDALNNRRISD